MLVQKLEASELWKLQDAARVAKATDISIKVLEGFRERFAGSKKAKIASFLLGKIASDKKGELAVATTWFSTYLHEDPDGPLAEEALGRLIVLHEKTGNRKASKKAAKRYLRKYKNGSFEGVARSVADSE